MVAQSMRPKWRVDTCYVPTPEGVYLRGNKSRLFLKGKSLHTLLKHLIPHLNGTVTLEELTGGLDADRKRMVTNLLEKLLANQFLHDTSLDQPHTLRPLDMETYAAGIAFIESFQSSAASRFERFCQQHLLLIGSGIGLTSLVQASLNCGARKISVITMPEDNAACQQEIHALFANSASEEEARLLHMLSWDDQTEVNKIIQAADAVLHIADRPRLARAQLLNKLCIEQQKTLLQALIVEDCAWIDPLVYPESDGCWECAWRRLQDNLTEHSEQFSLDALQDQSISADCRTLSASSAALIANRLTLGLFHHLTQTTPTEAASMLVAFNLTSFLSESHTFLPHPHCQACQHPAVSTAPQFLEQIQRLQQQEPIDPESLLENIIPYVDTRLGLFTAFEMCDFMQVPLAIYQISVSNSQLNEPLSVIAASTDASAARTRVAQKACECYAAALVDERRLLDRETAQRLSALAITTEQCLEARNPSSTDERWTWAMDVHTQQAALVPGSQVFASPGQRARGLASGATWEEALCRALADWCNYLTVTEMQSAHQAYPQVDLASTSMTSEGQYLMRLLQAAGVEITVYDLTGTLQVPTFAICIDEQVVAYATDCDSARALNMGLERALQQCQSALFQQADYALAPVPDLPANLRGEHLTVPNYTLPGTWPARRQWLLERLQANGLRACVVPLDHDPALARLMPFIVRVVVSRRELEKGA